MSITHLAFFQLLAQTLLQICLCSCQRWLLLLLPVVQGSHHLCRVSCVMQHQQMQWMLIQLQLMPLLNPQQVLLPAAAQRRTRTRRPILCGLLPSSPLLARVMLSSPVAASRHDALG